MRRWLSSVRDDELDRRSSEQTGKKQCTGGHLPTCYDLDVESRFRPNRLEFFALVAVIVTTTLFLSAALNAADLYTRTMSVWEKAGGCFGWLFATFGPISVAIAFWRWSKRLNNAWILHLLMLPLAYALVRSGGSLMLFMIGARDFDDTIGGPVIQAIVLFGLAVIGYYWAVLYTVFQKTPKQAKGS